MEDLTKKLKVGDTVYVPLKITEFEHDANFPIIGELLGGGHLTFKSDGKYNHNSKCCDILLSVSQYPKVMEVSDDQMDWQKRTVIYKSNCFYIALTKAQDGTDSNQGTFCWTYAREIQTPERVKLTIQDIADKLGVDAGLIDIIK